jgi:DNA repair protein RecN (Recombination protein N)
VRKETLTETDINDPRTVIRVTTLNDQQRSQELAQLTGGNSAIEALSFAQSLLVQAAKKRQRYHQSP